MLSEIGGKSDTSLLNNSCSTGTTENNCGMASNNQVQESSPTQFPSDLHTSGTSETGPLGKHIIAIHRVFF